MPAVSVIVPIYNTEKYLRQCVDSLLSQTLENIEIILVEDGSPDNCPSICDVYARANARVNVIHKKNEGLGMARNSGIKAAKGEFAAFVDSDDFANARMLESLYVAARENGADTAFCGFNRLSRKNVVAPHREVLRTEIHEDLKTLALSMFGSLPENKTDYKFEPSVWKGLYSLSVINSNGLLFPSENEFISEDIIFNIKYLARAKKAVIIPDCLYFYRENAASLSNMFRENRFDKNKIMYHEIMKTIPSSNIYAARYLFASARTQAAHISRAKIGALEKKRLLLNVANDAVFRQTYETYPVRKLPFRHKSCVNSLYKRRVNITLALTKLNFFRISLKAVGMRIRDNFQLSSQLKKPALKIFKLTILGKKR